MLTNYDTYIDDTIYCNNRSIKEVDGVKQLGGWNPNGGRTDSNYNLQFNEHYVTDLSCPNVTDRFSVSNTSAQLTYKVGLMTSPEKNLLSNSNATVSAYSYWLGSPSKSSGNAAHSRLADASGGNSEYLVNYNYGVRPAVSLTTGIEYSDGDGSMTNPYVVETS